MDLFRCLLVLALGWLSGAAWAVDASPSPPMTTRLVVQFKATAQMQAPSARLPAATPLERATERVKALAADARIPLTASHSMGNGAVVVRMDRARTLGEARAIADQLARHPEVESVGIDVWVRRQAFVPNDTHFREQWALQPRAAGPAGTAAFSNAWDVRGAASFMGSPSVIVALIDTGRIAHDDLAANEILGYDFVSAGTIEGVEVSGDGDGRDPDPSDPGDYCTPRGQQSSWHGLKMASIIAAVAGNSKGVAGAAAHVRVLQVRALGRCGGWLSDVADALSWSVGVSVSGVPANPSASQVRVANLSLGSVPGLDCADPGFGYMSKAVQAALNAGVVVVAAAGNEGATSLGLPAGCPGVIAVGAHTASGELASYSNRHSGVALTAPGGGCSLVSNRQDCDQGIAVLGNDGKLGPTTNNDLARAGGTSAAAPFVSAAAALMLSLNDTLTPSQVRTILMETARPHPAGSYCATRPGECGSGLLDAEAAVLRVRDGPLPGNPQHSGGGALAWGWLALLGLAALRARHLQAN